MAAWARRNAAGLILCWLALGTLAALSWHRLGENAVGIDDANIVFVYARNLAHGEGFVYHPGGERVEGFSSLLWTLVVAAAYVVLDSPEWLLVVLNVLVAGAALAAAASYCRRQLAMPGWAVVGWCLLPTAWTLWCTVSLLETGVWSVLILLSTLALLERLGAARSQGGVEGEPRAVRSPEGSAARAAARAAACLGPLLVLTRPDGLLWAPLFVALHLIASVLLGDGVAAAGRRALLPAATAAGTVIAVTAFRLVWFGFPLPNTYYAKVSNDLLWSIRAGLDYLRTFVTTNAVVPPALVAVAYLVWDGLRHLLRLRPAQPAERGQALRGLALAVVIATALAIPVALGGDHFVLHRFYIPAWPLLGLALIDAASRLKPRLGLDPAIRRPEGGAVVWLAAMLALVVYSASPEQWHRPIKLWREFSIAFEGRAAGSALSRIFPGPSRPRVGVIAAGGVALTWAGETVDLMGLNNLRMGHSPGDRKGWKNHAAFNRQVFFELAPDLAIPSLARCSAAGTLPALQRMPRTYTEAALRGLLRESEFNSRYAPATIAIPGEDDRCVFAWVRRDRLAALGAEPLPEPPTPPGGWPLP